MGTNLWITTTKRLEKNAESFQKDDGPERYRKSGPNKDPENE